MGRRLGVALLGAALATGTAALAGSPGVVAQDAPYTQVLQSVRGLDPIACGLVTRSLHNRWGSGSVRPVVDVPDQGEPGIATEVEELINQRPGPADLDELLAGLGDADRCVRNLAAEFLGWMDDPNPVDQLTPLVRGGGAAALPALRALGHGEWREALPLLVGTLGSRNAEVRAAAAWALGGLEQPSSIDALGAVVSDPDVSVRRTAIWALGQIERSAALPLVMPALNDPEASVRLNAAWALGQIEDSEAIPALVARLGTDTDPVVRNAIAWALGQIE